MSHGRAIDPLPLEDFPTEQESADPGFTQLFSELVGDAGTPADGFEDAVLEASALLDSLDAGLGLLGGQTGGTLDEAFADIETLDAGPVGDNLISFQTDLPAAFAPVDNLGNLITGVTLPAPPGVGGGGGGAGGGQGPPPPCAAILGMGNPGPPTIPFTQTAYFHNPTSGPITVLDVRLFPDKPDVYTVTTQCAGVTLNPGDSCLISVTANVDPGPGVAVQIVLDTDTFGAVNLCASTGYAPGVVTGGGGIGSGPPGHCGGSQIIRAHLRLPVGKHPIFGYCA